MCKNIYHYRPWLWAGRVDQYFFPAMNEIIERYALLTQYHYNGLLKLDRRESCMLFNCYSLSGNIFQTRQVSSMIHSAGLTVLPVVNIFFAWNLCFARFWKVGTYVRTYGQHVLKQWSLPDVTCGSAEWINML